MPEGILLFGVCIMMVLLFRWLLAHDNAPDAKSDGLFSLREGKKIAKRERRADSGFGEKRS